VRQGGHATNMCLESRLERIYAFGAVSWM